MKVLIHKKKMLLVKEKNSETISDLGKHSFKMSLQHDDLFSIESFVKNRIECNHPLNFYKFSCNGYLLLHRTLILDFVLSYENL